MKRREAIKTSAALGGGLILNSNLQASKARTTQAERLNLKGTFQHSVSRWCFNDFEFEELCKEVSAMGMHSIELTGPEEWAIMKEYGLTSAMGWDTYPEGVGLDNFYSNPDNHDALFTYYEQLIPKALDAGVKNLICLSGQRQGRGDLENMVHCKNGIRKVMPLFEEAGMTLSIENLNSKVDHPDHQFDKMQWGIALCEMVESPNFKILYDIYHAQIMEGNVVATIRKYHSYISHYHTAGVPGRNEIDGSQELNYAFIMEEIKKTGYKGFIGQEFIPTGQSKEEKLLALKEAVLICDV